MLKKSVLAAAFATTLAVSHNAAATIVLVETNMGDFEINLFDQTTPKTVTNFLTYVKDGVYKIGDVELVAKESTFDRTKNTVKAINGTITKNGHMIVYDEIILEIKRAI